MDAQGGFALILKRTILYLLFCCLVFYTIVVTVSNYNNGMLLRKLNRFVPWDTSSMSDFIGNLYADVDYIDNTTDPSELAFMALRPKGAKSGYIPQEVIRGHPYLRERTYPKTLRRKKCKNCFPFVYEHVLLPKVCDGADRVDLLIIITTIPDTEGARDAVRNTWGKFSTNSKLHINVTKHVFLFGTGWDSDDQTKILAEHEKHGDVLQTNFVDSYFNLTLKVLSGYRWFSKYCKQARFILRTADDNYINIPNMLKLIDERKSEMKDSMAGQCGLRSNPIRDETSKWYLSWNEYPFRYFPAYCVGTAFLTSSRLTKNIIKTSVNVPHFILEDVYFGLVLKVLYRNSLNGIYNVKGFNLGVNTEDMTCPLMAPWYSIHNVDTTDMKRLWKNCQRGFN